MIPEEEIASLHEEVASAHAELAATRRELEALQDKLLFQPAQISSLSQQVAILTAENRALHEGNRRMENGMLDLIKSDGCMRCEEFDSYRNALGRITANLSAVGFVDSEGGFYADPNESDE